MKLGKLISRYKLCIRKSGIKWNRTVRKHKSLQLHRDCCLSLNSTVAISISFNLTLVQTLPPKNQAHPTFFPDAETAILDSVT